VCYACWEVFTFCISDNMVGIPLAGTRPWQSRPMKKQSSQVESTGNG
jgi:hypothetical protein